LQYLNVLVGSAEPPNELELLVARIVNNIGNATPRGYPLDVYNGYLE